MIFSPGRAVPCSPKIPEQVAGSETGRDPPRGSLGFGLTPLLPLLAGVALLRLAAAEHQELSVRGGGVGGATRGSDQAALFFEILEIKTV